MRNLILSSVLISVLCANPAWSQREELNHGLRLERAGRIETALQLYKTLYRNHPHDLQIFRALKRASFKLKKYDEFLLLISEAYEEDPKSEYALALGEANLRMGKTRDSDQWFTRFLQEKRTEASFYKVASFYVSMSMTEEAARIYEEGRKMLRDDFLFAKEMALLYRNSNLEYSLRESIRLYLAAPGERVWVERMLKQEIKKGSQTTVLRIIREEMDSHADKQELHILLGDVLVEMNDYTGALREYKLSEETRALLWLAEECREEGKLEIALEAYEDHLEKNPASVEIYIGMGDCYSAMNDFAKAERFYESAVIASEGRNVIEALYRLGEIEVQRGGFADARKHYMKIQEDFPDAAEEAVFRIIDSYIKEGEFEEAETKCEGAVEYDEARACYMLGEINYYRGEFTKAKEYYHKVTDRNPNSAWFNDSMERLILLSAPEEEVRAYAEAEALFLQRRYDESIEKSKLFLKDNPSSETSAHAIFLIARAYEEKRKPTVAIEGYRDVINNFPESYLCSHAQYKIGFLYLNELKDIENAKKALETVLFEYPESVLAEKVRNELRDLD